MKLLTRVLFILLLAGWTSTFAASVTTNAPNIQSLTPAEGRALLAQRPEKPRIVVAWSLDCAYCHRNLKTLAHEAQERHSFELILIAMEPFENAAILAPAQAKFGAQTFPSYAFAGAALEQFRYAIDPAWGGEMPRTWFIGTDGSRQAYSGVVKKERLLKWLSANK